MARRCKVNFGVPKRDLEVTIKFGADGSICITPSRQEAMKKFIELTQDMAIGVCQAISRGAKRLKMKRGKNNGNKG